MQHGEPSQTARRAATHRAVHQLVEHGAVFTDPFALAILNEPPEIIVADAKAHPERRPMRLFIAARHRFADDVVAAAVARGTRQLVILGAGLDTTALRNAHADVHTFEVDHPSTQAWKRERLSEAGMIAPQSLTFVAVDFEREKLGERLAAAGFEVARPSVFVWLGVVPYLTHDAIFETLAFIARCARSEVVFDYGEPLESAAPELREARERRAAAVAALGEPWLTYFDPPQLHAELRRLGFAEIEDLDAAAVAARYFKTMPAPAPRAGGHLLRAARVSAGV